MSFLISQLNPQIRKLDRLEIASQAVTRRQCQSLKGKTYKVELSFLVNLLAAAATVSHPYHITSYHI